MFTNILATSANIPQVSLRHRYPIFCAMSDKYQYITGKLLKGSCRGRLSILLLAGFTGIYFRKFAKIKSRKLSAHKNFMFYSNL